MEALMEVLLGDLLLGQLLGFMILGLIGATIFLLVKIARRHESINGNPEPWSWKFFWKDNLPRLFLTFILVYVWARFSDELTSVVPEGFQVFGHVAYILIGLLTDFISEKILKRISQIEIKV